MAGNGEEPRDIQQ